MLISFYFFASPFSLNVYLTSMRFILAFFLFCSVISPAFGQDSAVVITGQVYGINGTKDLLTLFVVNQKNQVGNFGNSNGTYEIKVHPSDTVLIGSIGYHTQKICVNDSAFKANYVIDVWLEPLEYYLKEVTVFAPRDLRRIYEDIEQLGYDPKDDMLSGYVDPLSSPITALYEMYSRHAKQERLAKKLINESKKRELLKELFEQYVDYHIIDLSNDQFDDFIDYLNVSDDFLKNASQYDFIIYVKQRYAYYMKQNKYE